MKAAVLCMILACPVFARPAKMVASWYGKHWEGRKMANGQPFRAEALTCAHKTLPMGTKLRLWVGGKPLVVSVTDRGPYVPGRDVDFSEAAARLLGLINPGVGTVVVEVLS